MHFWFGILKLGHEFNPYCLGAGKRMSICPGLNGNVPLHGAYFQSLRPGCVAALKSVCTGMEQGSLAVHVKDSFLSGP